MNKNIYAINAHVVSKEIKWLYYKTTEACLLKRLLDRSTALAEGHRKGCGLSRVSSGRGVVSDGKCMEAKALQTIDTLYITSYNYNNIAAGTYCTDKTELYGWRKLLVYSIQQTVNFRPDLFFIFCICNIFFHAIP